MFWAIPQEVLCTNAMLAHALLYSLVELSLCYFTGSNISSSAPEDGHHGVGR